MVSLIQKQFIVLVDNIVADNVPTPDDWSDILRAAGAKIIPKHRITNDIDYVLCDKKPGQKILDVVPPGVTIITGEFVIQCLVHQSILDPSRHEKFTIFG
jgi:hypothetical protein